MTELTVNRAHRLSRIGVSMAMLSFGLFLLVLNSGFGIKQAQVVPICVLEVKDKTGDVLPGCRVDIVNEEQAHFLTSYDTIRKAFVVLNLPVGRYTITASAFGLDTVINTVSVSADRHQFAITVGTPGDVYTYKKGIKFPYTSCPGQIGILYKKENKKQVWALCKRLGLTMPAENKPSLRRPDEAPGTEFTVAKVAATLDRDNSSELKSLRTSGVVISAGPLIIIGAGKQLQHAILSNEILVSYKSWNEASVNKFYAEHGLKLKAKNSPEEYLITAGPEVGEGINAMLKTLNEMPGTIAYAGFLYN
jgi:hypothetical protein